MKMRNLLPAALAVALTVVAGFYFLQRAEVASDVTPVADGSPVQ